MKQTEKIGNLRLLGAAIGDICGSFYEFKSCKDYGFELFPVGCDYTDDTILTAATADAIICGVDFASDFASFYRSWAAEFPNPTGCYGSSFSAWLRSSSSVGYNSLGNGCAMRVSPCAYVSHDYNVVLDFASRSSMVTHNHWQGIRAAQAVTTCIFMLNHRASRDAVLECMKSDFLYDIPSLDADYASLQRGYRYTERADETVNMAIWCALSASSFEDAIRKAVALGGDADTLGAITGSIAECLFRIPSFMVDRALAILHPEIVDVINCFNRIYV